MRVLSTESAQMFDLWFQLSAVCAGLSTVHASRQAPAMVLVSCTGAGAKTCSYGLIPGSVVLDSRVAEAEIAKMDNAYLAASVAMLLILLHLLLCLLLLQLSESLRNNSSITSVNLSGNHIGTEGVQVRTEHWHCCRLSSHYTAVIDAAAWLRCM